MDMNSKLYTMKDLSCDRSEPSFYLEIVKPKIKVTWVSKIRCRFCDLIKRILR